MPDQRVEWIPFLNEVFRKQGIYKDGNGYKWAENDSAPLTPLSKPVKECRIALTSGCGARLKSQPIWEKEERKDPGWRDDISFREIPKDTKFSDVVITAATHSYDSEMDPNIMIPLDRMKEMEEGSYFRERAPYYFTHHGTWRRGKLVRETVPKMVQRFREMEVDAVISFAQ